MRFFVNTIGVVVDTRNNLIAALMVQAMDNDNHNCQLFRAAVEEIVRLRKKIREIKNDADRA